MIRLTLIAVLQAFSFGLFAQEWVIGVVTDAQTHDPLVFCNISVKGSTKGTISNADGRFSLEINNMHDTLVFTYIGYHNLVIDAGKAIDQKNFTLSRRAISLKEVIILSETDTLYEWVVDCRKNMRRNRQNYTSKVYYGLETSTRDQPVELLEGYYNGYMTGTVVNELMLKNGRVGLAPIDNYFVSMNTSKGVSMYNLTEQSGNYPANPLQFNKRELKKKFVVTEGETNGNMVRIIFKPVEGDNDSFSGSLWIDLFRKLPVKIELTAGETDDHPFIPLFPDDSLSHVGISLTYLFSADENPTLSQIRFEYGFDYLSRRIKGKPVLTPKNLLREITSKGILFFYDYGNPFILPLFKYNNDFDDYRKLSFIPYNEDFWNHANQILLTDQQKESLGFFAREGALINYHPDNHGGDFLPITFHFDSIQPFTTSIFEYNYLFWSEENRIRLTPGHLSKKGIPSTGMTGISVYDLFHLEVQILLDINIIKNKTVSRSFTVFDPASTWYKIPPEDYTAAFINIYFDLYEIGRRKMQATLDSGEYTPQEAIQIYNKTVEEISRTTRTYFQEVQLGANRKYLKKWNEYVASQLGTDNIRLFNP
jgi:hypothetical protein